MMHEATGKTTSAVEEAGDELGRRECGVRD